MTTPHLNTPSRYDYNRGCVVHDLPPFHTVDRTIILVEGIFALHRHLVDLYHVSIFLDTAPQIVEHRYLKRHSERGTGDEATISNTFHEAVILAYKAYIEPTRKNAQLVIQAGDSIGVKDVLLWQSEIIF